MQLTTFELMLIAPVVASQARSENNTLAMRTAFNSIAERMADELSKADEKEVIAAAQDIAKMDPRCANKMAQLMEGLRLIEIIRRAQE